jgi:hypothetical protein
VSQCELARNPFSSAGLRREVVEPKVSEHHGRVFQTTGDGLLVEFQSPEQTVRCAVEIQDAVVPTVAQAPFQTLELRIGINLGDMIIKEDGDVWGGCGRGGPIRANRRSRWYLAVRDDLRGSPGQAPNSFEDRGEYVEWVADVLYLRREEDAEKLREGLRPAGLPEESARSPRRATAFLNLRFASVTQRSRWSLQNPSLDHPVP